MGFYFIELVRETSKGRNSVSLCRARFCAGLLYSSCYTGQGAPSINILKFCQHLLSVVVVKSLY